MDLYMQDTFGAHIQMQAAEIFAKLVAQPGILNCASQEVAKLNRFWIKLKEFWNEQFPKTLFSF